MRKIFVFLLTACMVLSFASCAAFDIVINELKPQEKVFLVENYNLKITADDTFKDKTGGSFDLQITNEQSYVSIMAYKYEDLSEGQTTMDIYDAQHEDLLGKRENVSTIEERKTEEKSEYTLTQTLFSAENNGVENYYLSYLIDFKDYGTFAWVMVTGTPSYIKSQREYFHNIVCSLAIAEQNEID